MAKVAEYEGSVSFKADDKKIAVSIEVMQGMFRTSYSVSLSPEGFAKAWKGKAEAVVLEDAVQTRQKKEAE